MIEHYSARWKIESGFKELKHEIGALDNQARKKESVENHFELCCMAVTMTWIYAMKREKAPAKRLQNLRTFTFSDIREEIRKEYTDKSINFNGVWEVIKLFGAGFINCGVLWFVLDVNCLVIQLRLTKHI